MGTNDLDYSKEVSGRCRVCNIRYIWKKNHPKLKDAVCPNCGRPTLRATTHQFKGKTYKISGGLPCQKVVTRL